VLGDRPEPGRPPRDDVEVTAAQLLDIPSVGGEVTEAGVHDNISIAIRYIESWLRGTGAAAIDNLMEDAATAGDLALAGVAVAARQHVTAEGTRIDQTSIVRIMAAAVAELPRFEGDRFDDAISVFRSVALEPEFPTFLTVGAYARFM
jgi:malate synthase